MSAFFGNCNLGQKSLGKCDALNCLSDKDYILPTFPPPQFQCWLKRPPKACTVFCTTLSTLVWGGRGGGQINFVCECMSKDVHAK